MGNDNSYLLQDTYMCCEICVKNNKQHKIFFLNTGTPYKDSNKNVWIEAKYRCTNGHLFYTRELKSNYYNRVEHNNSQINKINTLKKRVAELEEIIKQNNIGIEPSAPILVVAECVSENK